MNCSIEGCGDRYYGRGYCKKHHQWRWKRGLLPKLTMPTLAERIERRIEPVTESGCWIWTGHINNKGYGTVGFKKTRMYVHRVMYEMHRGKIPDDLEICHRCDVPACVNPNHMFLGTHLDNMRDSARKGRAKQPTLKFGVNHPMARLTLDQVTRIRISDESIRSLAKHFGVGYWVVWNCRNRKTYP